MMGANVMALDGVNQALKEKYKAILNSSIDLPNPEKMSEIFLTSVRDGYEGAKRKIMIIGREPGGDVKKGWYWGVAGSKSILQPILKSEDKSAYVDSAMQYHKVFFSSILSGKNERGSTFGNFLREVRNSLNGDDCGMIYSNLFCYSTNEGKIPNRLGKEGYAVIKMLSKDLLLSQIEILKPDTIIFANGTSGPSVDFRRECFPMDQCICRDNYEKDGISDIQLWKFKFDGIQCYRIQHPSSHHPASSPARKYFLENVLFRD